VHSPHSRLTRRALLLAATVPLTAALVLAGCDSDGFAGGEGGGGPSVPYGSSVEVYREALAEMEPVQLTVQTTAVTADRAASLLAMLDRVTEYSGDKITFDVIFAGALVPANADVDDALLAGLLDIAAYSMSSEETEYPASALMMDATVLRDPRYVTGWWSTEAAYAEVAYSSENVLGEWESKGLLPLSILSPGAPAVLVCSSPATTLSDLAGLKVRASNPLYMRQAEALGMIPVQMDTVEVYEGIVRGLIDCNLGPVTVMFGTGMFEIARHVVIPATTSFATTPSSLLAGTRVRSLPLAAQQLLVESAHAYQAESISVLSGALGGALPVLTGQLGGTWDALDAEADAALAAENQVILAETSASAVTGASALATDLEAATLAWIERVIELGYTDEGTIGDLPDWFTTGADPQPWFDAVVTDVLAAGHSPV